jgi:hypothetical protein
MDDYSKKAFTSVSDKLETALVRIEKQQALPEKSLFSTDRQSNLKKIDTIYDDILCALQVGRLTELRDRYRAIGVELEAKRQQVDTFRREQLTAPEKAVFETTRSGYQKKIDEEKVEINAHEAEQTQIEEALVQELRNVGLSATTSHVRMFLLYPSRDDIFALHTAFFNAKEIISQLSGLNQQSLDRSNNAKRYYGMYMVLVRILVEAHDRLIASLEKEHFPRLNELLAEATDARRDAESLLRKDQPDDARVTLKNNVRTLEITERVARLFMEFMENQRQAIVRNRARAEKRAQVVANTYRTASVAAELVRLMDESQNELAALSDMVLPDMKDFASPEIEARFAELAKKLGAGPKLLPAST